jgi:hypothetical protein
MQKVLQWAAPCGFPQAMDSPHPREPNFSPQIEVPYLFGKCQFKPYSGKNLAPIFPARSMCPIAQYGRYVEKVRAPLMSHRPASLYPHIFAQKPASPKSLGIDTSRHHVCQLKI